MTVIHKRINYYTLLHITLKCLNIFENQFYKIFNKSLVDIRKLPRQTMHLLFLTI